MRFGYYKLGDGQGSSSGDSGERKGTASIETDLGRLFLLGFMLVAGIIGIYLSRSSNEPSYVLESSIEKTLQQSFRTSLEGSVSFRGAVLESYRSHHRYDPDNGLSAISRERSSGQPPVDPLSAFEWILQTETIIEHDKQDMYSHGTRHFSGSLVIEGDSGSVGGIFNFWVDMKTHEAVRLEIAKVERDITTPDDPEPASRETYINIRYFDFR
ncbi:hypothetical protein ACFL6P_04695 [Candidatus Latescibacterota bacterium]